MAARDESPWASQQVERLDNLKGHVNRMREFLVNGSSDGDDAAD